MVTDPQDPELRAQTLRFLLGEPATAVHFNNQQHWPQVIRLCHEWNVAHWLRHRIAQCGAQLNEACRGELERICFGSGLITARAIKSGLDAMALLETNSIPCAGFKGFASMAHLYGVESGLRSMHDVDIVIAPRHAQQALDVLLQNGYRPDLEIPVEDYVDFVKQSPGSGGNQAIGMANARGGAIDLHWQLGGIDTDELLRRSVRIQTLGRAARVVSPFDFLLLGAHHAFRNNFTVDRMIHDLLDFDAWQQRLGEQSNMTELLELGARSRLNAPLLALDIISSNTRGTAPSASLAHAAPRDRHEAEALAELFSHQVTAGPLREDLVYLCDPRILLGMAATATRDWSRFRSTMQRMDQAKGAPETLLKRLLRLLGAVSQLGPRQWLQVRRLAQAKRAMLDNR